MNVDPLNLESQNQAKNIPVGLPSSPIKIWGKSVTQIEQQLKLKYKFAYISFRFLTPLPSTGSKPVFILKKVNILFMCL